MCVTLCNGMPLNDRTGWLGGFVFLEKIISTGGFAGSGLKPFSIGTPNFVSSLNRDSGPGKQYYDNQLP